MDIWERIGNSYQNKFNELVNMNIYNDKNDNLFFCSYLANNGFKINDKVLDLNYLKVFKSNINSYGLKKIMDIIKSIDILEMEYSKNKTIIQYLEKLLLFYMDINDN